MKNGILITGGVKDPNLIALCLTARMLSIPVLPLLVDVSYKPAIRWDLESGELHLNSSVINPQGCFLRRDVFHAGKDVEKHCAQAWYTVVKGWLADHTEIRWLNRQYAFRFTNKLDMLRRAIQFGLKTPATVVTNELNFEQDEMNRLVAKPAAGGGYCVELVELSIEPNSRDYLGTSPAIVQDKIFGCDTRIYRVGDEFFGFRIHSQKVDYRRSRNRKIEYIEKLDSSIIRPLKEMMSSLGMDWGAADFKQCHDDGEFYFLELNSNPMFSVFDAVAQGILTKAILQFLTCKK